MPDLPILVLNAGSSSIKAGLFDGSCRPLGRVDVTGIGMPGQAADNAAALGHVLDELARRGTPLAACRAVAHRVVHGGAALTETLRITPSVRDAIEACVPLAPLHNPHHLAAINAIASRAPDLPQYACFDTAFHASMPECARRYALPPGPNTDGLRRYGFHGTSYAALVRHLPTQISAPLPARLLALHLGNGASLCAILNGASVATTMGYSPLGGLTMGTRSGDIDPGAVLALAERMGIAPARDLLTNQSGLLGLSGLSADMRDLLAADTPAARFAVDHFCYWAARHAGSMIAAMGGLDAIAFTGGIGENAAPVRVRIADLLAWAGDVPVFIVPAEEEAQIAREALEVMDSEGRQ